MQTAAGMRSITGDRRDSPVKLLAQPSLDLDLILILYHDSHHHHQ